MAGVPTFNISIFILSLSNINEQTLSVTIRQHRSEREGDSYNFYYEHPIHDLMRINHPISTTF